MWIKYGVIFNDCHAQLPTVEKIDDRLRIYYSTRIENKSYINYFEVEEHDPCKVVYKNKDHILQPGDRGCFDDAGVMPSSIVQINPNLSWMYYTGWNVCKNSVPYGHGIGILIRDKNTFQRYSIGPIMDRSVDNPFLVNSPFVLKNETWEMWFCQGVGWEEDFPKYVISYAVSQDGINWKLETHNVFNDSKDFACSRPCIVDSSAWYARKTKTTPYEIVRKGDKFDTINVSDSGWDSQMVCYPYIYNNYMFYNGNGYGESGIGLAKWV